jgi:hypothetical protein
MTPEGKVKQWFKDRFDQRYGHLTTWWYAPPGGAYGQAGTGDRVALIDHVALMVEIKADGQKLTPLQSKRLRDFDAAGGVAASLIGKDLPQVVAIFAEIDRRRALWHAALRSDHAHVHQS